MLRQIIAGTLLLTVTTGCNHASDSTTSSAAGSSGGPAANGGKGQGFLFGRTYKMGDKDSYTMKMEQSTGNMTMSMTVTQEVTKVYDNGDADIKETSSDIVMNTGGKEIKPPATPAITLRIDKYGAPQGGAMSSMGGGFGSALSKLTGGISVGQTVPYDYANPAKPGSHDVGKITYVSADGPSKFHVVSDITNPNSDPTHMEGDMSIDADSKKPISMDLTMTTTGKSPSKTHFVMTLKTT